MTESDLVPLQCSPETLAALATRLTRFGPAEGAPDWLVSAVWLCTDDCHYLATSFTNVLSDGYVARPLNIHTPQALASEVEREIPDIEDRLKGRGSNVSLPQACGHFGAPDSLHIWDPAPYSTKVLIRVAERLLTTRRVACGLIFESERARSVLVGTDTATMAMVASEDETLIRRYRKDCEEVPAADFSGFA